MQSLKLLTSVFSWNELNKKLEELTKSGQAKFAGDIFENVCKYFLQTAPQYQTKLKNVWLLKEVKEDLRRKLNLPSTDEGIDLIAETFDNKYWAIQSKYRSDPKDTLTIKGDLATFANLAFNNCKNISLGLVMTTADKPPLKTKLLKGVSFVTLESFLELDDNNLEGWNLIKAKTKRKVIIPKASKPKPHQIKAIDETIKYFKTKERGKVIMPCGTGKSLTAFWIANELKAKSILIAVPSLTLLQQTLKVWTREYLIAGIKPNWLCVCSDQTVSNDQDDFVSNIYDLGIDVTTEKNEIKKFLKSKSHIKVVFTTYQSGKVTAAGSRGFTFDLGIMDEAHKTVGLDTKPMAHLIHQKNINIKHRLFMTATERLFRGDKKEYLSMDNPKDYGDLIYQLSFKEAIETKPPIISDYKILTFGITEPEIEAVYKDNKFIQIKKEINDIKAREFATALALRKAIKKLGIKNAISFHSSIRRANNFKAQQELISKVYPQYGKLKAFHVYGAMPANQRSSQMREFAESKGLMTNARCLTEGVDLPAIDCVIFTDPKKSKVDIVQAAGRALRLSPGKKFGYILIPLLIPENENVLEAAKDTAFEEIVATIRALAIQDSRIIEYLRAVSRGIVPKGGSPVDGITKINVLTKVNEQEFNKSIQLKVWDRLAFGNWRSYDECKNHAQKLKFKNKKEWLLYTQSKDYPKDMPKSIDDVYKNEWEGTGIFLGYKTTRFGEFVSYEEAKKFARNKKIKSKAEWHILTKSKNFPDNIPKTPDQIYKEFEGWGKFLGTKNIRGKNNFLTYKDCKIYAKSLKLRTVKEWLNLKDRPENVPQKPQYFYKNEWEGWSTFLGVEIVSSKEKTKFYCTYLQAKKYAKSLKLKNVKEWIVFTKNKNFPAKIPKKPNRWFKNEWETWGIFLGTGTESPHKKKFLNFKKAKSILRKFKLKNEREWRVFTKTAVFKKLNIPVAADVYYKNQGWKGYVDFFRF
jgi:superfamily II DNA or RNA helicase